MSYVTQLISDLRESYTREQIPPCPVCGSIRNRISAAGMGRITFCCSSKDADPVGKGDRFDECMAHFSKSRFETVARDSRVVELCQVAESAIAENAILQEERNWQPIETAPKDGTEFIAFVDGHRPPHLKNNFQVVCHYETSGKLFYCIGHEYGEVVGAKYWKPLSPDPKES